MNNQPVFNATGKMVPVRRSAFVEAVYSELENFETKLLNGDPDPVPNPISESLVVTVNNTTVMIPRDIQNDAIVSYMQTHPRLKHMIDNIETDASRSLLVDYDALNPRRNNDINEDTTDGDITKISQPGGTRIFVLACVVLLGLLMFLYRDSLKLT